MSRDPLCDYQIHFAKRQPCPICELFGKARADERGRVIDEAVAAIRCAVTSPTLGVQKAIRAVEALKVTA